MKKPLQRTCIGCNTKKDKTDFLRIVKNKNGYIKIEKFNRIDGRGAYICKNINCFEKAKKLRRLERSFKMKINDKIYDELRGVIVDK